MKWKHLRKCICMSLIMIAVLMLSSFSVNAQQWRVTNQATVAWDAVTTLDNGDPLPANHTIKYRVYLSNAITDPDKTNPALLGGVDLFEYVITLNTEGRYFVGVQAVRYDENAVEVSISTINWSDENGVNTPNPFGLVHYLPPAIPINLR